MFRIVFRFRNATCMFVSLKSFVILFVALPLYVKMAHLVFSCWESVFFLCLYWFRCLVHKFVLYLLLCSVSFMTFSSFLFLFLLLCICALCSLDS
jgi:hypothetical protein